LPTMSAGRKRGYSEFACPACSQASSRDAASEMPGLAARAFGGDVLLLRLGRCYDVVVSRRRNGIRTAESPAVSANMLDGSGAIWATGPTNFVRSPLDVKT